MNTRPASTSPAPVPPALAALRAHWARMAPREQSLVLAAAAVVGLALLWWVLLAPALQQLRGSGARHAAVDAQLQRMQALQAYMRSFPDDQLAALKAEVSTLHHSGALRRRA